MTSVERSRAGVGILLGAVALGSIASVMGFRAVFVDWSFLSAAIVGGVVGTAVGAFSWWRQLLVGETLGVSVVAFAVVGIVATGGIPSGDSVSSFASGLRSGWAELLSLTPPIEATAELRVLPFTLAWIAATISVEFVRRTNTAVLVSVGPLTALAISVLLTAENRSVALVQGAAVGLTTLVVGAVARRRTDTEPASPASPGSNRGRRREQVTAAVLIGVVTIGSVLLAPRLPLADANERYDLRDRSDPPWDPLQTPSPLVELKASLRDDRSDDVVFTVESTGRPTRFPVAVLGDFDGVVWNVRSGGGRDAAAEFRPVSVAPPPEPAGDRSIEVEPVTTTITIESLTGPWLPTAGWPTEIAVDDPDGSVPRVRMNLVTGTVALPAGVTEGLTVTSSALPRAEPPETVLAGTTITPDPDERDVSAIPPPIRNLAGDVLEGAAQGWEQVAAIRDRFTSQGFYDTSSEARPGHSYFRLAEFLDDPDRLVGFEEQYAASAAVVARIARLPVRVVVGYTVPSGRYDADGVVEVVAADATAWVEVRVDDLGWVPVDVTPDRSREPSAESTGVTVEEVAVPSPPPPPDIPPDNDVFAGDEDDEENDDEDEEETDDPIAAEGGIAAGVLVGVAVGTVLGVIVALLAVIVLVKARRRERRRRLDDPAARVGAAWRELLDRYDEAGVPVTPDTTPGDAVRVVAEHERSQSEEELTGLRDVVRRAAFHPEPPTPDDGDTAWKYHDELVGALYGSRSAWQRFQMRADPRTLRSETWTPKRTSAPADRAVAGRQPEHPDDES